MYLLAQLQIAGPPVAVSQLQPYISIIALDRGRFSPYQAVARVTPLFMRGIVIHLFSTAVGQGPLQGRSR